MKVDGRNVRTRAKFANQITRIEWLKPTSITKEWTFIMPLETAAKNDTRIKNGTARLNEGDKYWRSELTGLTKVSQRLRSNKRSAS